MISCNTPPCPPIDCKLGPWTNTGSCNGQCGSGVGIQVEDRQVITPAANGGAACDTLLTQVVLCNPPPCPPPISINDINGSYSQTCSSIALNGNTLSASCATLTPPNTIPTSIDVTTCQRRTNNINNININNQYDIVNCNGNLTCYEKAAADPNLSYCSIDGY